MSPTATGVRWWAFASLPVNGAKRGDVEIYQCLRFFTVTGHNLPAALSAPTIARNPAGVLWVYETYCKDKDEATSAPATASQTSTTTILDDPELLRRARGAANGHRFSTLFGGDWEAFHASQSEADLDLCGMLAFWTGRDAARIDGLFRRSKLMRSKWDERRGATTYGAMTIEEAVKGCRDAYQPRVKRLQVAASTSCRPGTPPACPRSS